MGNTNGIIKYILSRKEGQQFLAASLFVIVALATFSCVLLVKIEKLNNEKNQAIEQLSNEKNQAIIQGEERLVESYKQRNDDLTRFQKPVDSIKAQLEIFKIKKQMK